MQLSNKILGVKTSEIREFNNYARKAGAEVFMTLGEPDFDTPQEISDALIDSLNNHNTKYSPTNGSESLRKKISEFEEKRNGVHYTLDEVLVTHGSTEGLASAFFTMLNPNDEVIVFLPAYPMYRPMIEFAGGKVKAIDFSTNGFQISKKMLQENITKKTKCIILNSPNNPTGTVLNDESLKNVYDFVKGKDIFVICDDVYNQILFNKNATSFSKYTDIKDQIIVCQSYSKSYAMPGWRCGYMLASKEFISQAIKIHQYMIVCLNSFIQPAMEKALDYDNSKMIESYQIRRDYIYQRLIDMGLECEKPEGAFYIFPSIKKFGLTSTEFCKRLVEEYKVAVIPGHCFEIDDHIRLSYCVSQETIKTALDRLEQFIATL